MEGLGDSVAVEFGGELDAHFGRALVRGSSAVVTECGAAHRTRLAAESAGHDVIAGLKHGSGFRLDTVRYTPPVLSAIS